MHPLIGAGGHCVYNPEPLADIVDFFALGDGEEVVSDITEVIHQFKSIKNVMQSRQELLFELSKIEGVYVPSLYQATYDINGAQILKPISDEVPELIEKRTIVDLEEWPYPKEQLVPITEVVHDRLNVEVFRGAHEGVGFAKQECVLGLYDKHL